MGATGVNVHNSEVRAYFFPQEGNAYYNAIRYDPTPAAGPPTPGPSYYALLLFARLAQGTTGLRPVTLDATVPRLGLGSAHDPLGPATVSHQQGLDGRHGQRAGAPGAASR